MRNIGRQPLGEKSKRVTFLLPRDLYVRICHKADSRQLSRSAVIREALALHFHEEEGQA